MKKKYGVDYSSIAMLGRQKLLIEGQVKLLSRYLNVNDIQQEDGYSEKFWNVLAGREIYVDSFDISSYENATVLHDMNKPISAEYMGKYGAVFDGGTLEHLFNYPQALHNAMNMVRPGGFLMLETAANNRFGHGFYQFSPELFFCTLTSRNGFEVLDMTEVCERKTGAIHRIKYYGISDFTKTGRSLETATRGITSLYVLARRIGDVPDDLVIQQNGFISTWDEPADLALRVKNKVRDAIIKRRVGLNFYNQLVGIKHSVLLKMYIREYDLDRELCKYF